MTKKEMKEAALQKMNGYPNEVIPFNFKVFGKALVDFRTSNDVSFSELTLVTGIPRPTIYRVELGKGCHINNALLLCECMGKKFTDFLIPKPSKK